LPSQHGCNAEAVYSLRALLYQRLRMPAPRRIPREAIHQVTVVGAGAVGASWTALFLARGQEVTVTDPDPVAEARLRYYIDEAWRALRILGVSSHGSPEHMAFTTDLTRAVSRAQFIQECAPESGPGKVAIIERLDASTPAEVIIASSSARAPMSLMQARCTHPQRCVLAEPCSPAHIMPLVEVVGGQLTSAETIERTMRFYASIGRKPVHVRKEIAGNVASRLQAALYREMIHLIDQEVLDVRDADAAVCWGPGLRWGIMGPALLCELGAPAGGVHHLLEHLAGPVSALWSDLGTPALTPQLRRRIIEGVRSEVGARSRAQLTRQRDELLIGLLKLHARLSRKPRHASRVARNRERAKSNGTEGQQR
jgi:carnitine 3-dehydrogenase